MQEPPSKLIPALIGGLVIGTLSIIGYCLCCMWILAGGIVAAYLYKRKLPPEDYLNPGAGALVGFFSGIFGALFFTLMVYLFIAIADLQPGGETWENIIETQGHLSSLWNAFFEYIYEKSILSPVFLILSLFSNLIIFSIFGSVGGIMGAALFGKPKQVYIYNDTFKPENKI